MKEDNLNKIIAISIFFASILANGIGLILRLMYFRPATIVYVNLCGTISGLLFIIILAIFLFPKKAYDRFYTLCAIFIGFVSFPLIWLTNRSCTFYMYLNIMALAFGIISYKNRFSAVYGLVALINYLTIFYLKVACNTVFRCNTEYFIENYVQLSGGLLATYLFSFIVVYFTISNFNSLNTELKELSQKDFLTKTYNRLTLEKDLETIEFKFGAMLDIDHFKHINDTYGHLAGDSALRNLCRIIHNFESKDFILYRYGGEEFFIGSTLGSIEFFQKLESLFTAIEKDLKIENESITISIGVSEITTLESKAFFIKAADSQLYLAKESGRHQIYFNGKCILGKPLC